MRVGVAVAALCASLYVPATSSAQTSSGDKKQQLQDQIGEASFEEAAALANLQAIRDQKSAIDARVADLDQRLGATEARLVQLETEATRLAAINEWVQVRLQRAQTKLDKAQATLDATAAESYRSARVGSEYDVVLAAPPEDVAHGSVYLDAVAAKRDRAVRRVTGLRDAVESERRAVADEKSAADEAQFEVASARDSLAALRTEIEPARAEAAQQEAVEAAAVAEIQARKSEFEGQLAQLQAASDAIMAQLRASGSTGGAASPCDARPVPGGIGSGFGPRVHPIYGSTRMHTGADIHASWGEPIRSCRAGVVVNAGWNDGYGNCVIIDHGGGMATLYAHQSSIATSVGEQVAAGQTIGYVGSTGASTGPHLHFEVRLNGNPFDPAPYL